MQSSQVYTVRKNIFKFWVFFLLLLVPIWLPRLLLLSILKEDGVASIIDYFFIALRFDLKTVVIWYSPLFLIIGINFYLGFSLLKRLEQFLFLLLYFGAFVFNVGAILYYPTSKSILGKEVVSLISGQDTSIFIGYVSDYWIYFVLVLMSMIVVSIINKWTTLQVTKINSKILVTTGAAVLIALFARGSFALKPLNLLDAYAKLPANEAVSAVTPIYVLIESLTKPVLEEVNYYPENVLENELKHDSIVFKKLDGSNPNVCLILLESFGKEYTGGNKVGRPSYTPFLDSLTEESLSFENAYASGLRSMDAVASIFVGVPALMKQSFISSLYSQSDIVSALENADRNNYYTSFFHGADELSMGFKPFLIAQGLDQYVARQQYPDRSDFDGKWGVFDGPFLEHGLDQISEQPEPWFSSIFTLSSHHPYTVPSEYEYLSEGSLEIHKSVRYTDLALMNFFKLAKSKEWYENTIFIITADHSSINESTEYRTYRGKYSVPLLVFSPKWIEPRKIEYPVSHIDLFPTINQMLGTENLVAMGKPILDSARHTVINYDGNVYTITNDSLTLQWNGVTDYELYAYLDDPKHSEDLATMLRKQGESMFGELKLFIQKYNYRLLNNDFK